MEKLQLKFFKLGIFFITYTIIFFILFSTLKYTLPFLLALIFAYILKYPTKLMMKKINATAAALISTILFYGVILFITIMIFTALTNEIIGLTKYLQKIITNNSDFIYNYLSYLPSYFNNLALDPMIIESIKSNLGTAAENILSTSVTIGTLIIQGLLSFLGYIPYIIMVVIFSLLTTFFFTKKLSSNQSKFHDWLPAESSKFFEILTYVRKMLINYLLSYLFIIFVTFLITLLGFSIFRIKYALVLSLLCAILDLLPVLGIPLVYFPIAILNLVSKNYIVGFGLLILYAIVFIVRQIIEPKIVSSTLGLNPVAVLSAIFIGLQAGGFLGMIFCIFLIVFYEILNKVNVI